MIKAKKDRANTGIYGISGNAAHDIVERFYKDELTHEEMLETYEAQLMDFNFAGLKYDRSDEIKNENIANKYENCLRHFFLHHERIESKLFLEKFITAKVGKYHFQGYIDAFHKEMRDDKPTIVITDWKTSSLYTGAKVVAEMGQLVLYAGAMRQLTNMPVENLVGRWNFLKYVEVEYTLAKGDKRTRIVERNGIGKALKANARTWLKKEEGLTDVEIEDYLDAMAAEDKDYTNNSIEVLPQSVQDKYVIRDCYVEIPLTQKVIDDLMKEMEGVIDEVVAKTKEYDKTKDENIFWQDVTAQSSYFMANLSDYSHKIHKPYAEYLKGLKIFNDDEREDLYSNDSDNDTDDEFDALFD